MSAIPTPAALKDLIAPEKMKVLEEHCPNWIHHITQSENWNRARLLDMGGSLYKNLNDVCNCAVAECFGFSDNYEHDEGMDYLQSEEFSRISRKIFVYAESLHCEEYVLYKIKNETPNIFKAYAAFINLGIVFNDLADQLVHHKSFVESRKQEAAA